MFKCFLQTILSFYYGIDEELFCILPCPPYLNTDNILYDKLTKEQVNNLITLIDIGFNEKIKAIKSKEDNRSLLYHFFYNTKLSTDNKFVYIFLDKISKDSKMFWVSNVIDLKELCIQTYKHTFSDSDSLKLVEILKHVMYKMYEILIPNVYRKEEKTYLQNLYLFVENLKPQKGKDVFENNADLNRIFQNLIFDLFLGHITLDEIPSTLHIDIKYYLTTYMCTTFNFCNVAKLFNEEDHVGDFKFMIDMGFNYRQLFYVFKNFLVPILVRYDTDVVFFQKVITNFVNSLFSVDMVTPPRFRRGITTKDIVENEWNNLFCQSLFLFKSEMANKLFYQTLFNSFYNENHNKIDTLDYIRIMCKSFSNRCRRYYKSMTIKLFDYDDEIDVSELEELMSNLIDYHSLLQGIKTNILEKSVYDALAKLSEDVIEKKKYQISLFIACFRCKRKYEALLNLCEIIGISFTDKKQVEEIEQKLEIYKQLGINEYGIVTTLLSL